ncbi:MAG: alpha-L-fucosidase, partial [Bacteroidetes bacterium]
SATTIGYKRILRFPTVEATQLRFSITGSKCGAVISKIGVFRAPQILVPPEVTRNQSGEVLITPSDEESVVFYTLDGSSPTPASLKYTGPVPTGGKVEVRAIAHDPSNGESSPERRESFDLPRKDWRIMGTGDERAYAVIDGDRSTAWHQGAENKPVDLVIDMGKVQDISGFRYYPDQRLWGPGIISHYEFYIAVEPDQWILADQGEFPNIRNNPVWQAREFVPARARYFRLRALKIIGGEHETGYGEIDVITLP